MPVTGANSDPHPRTESFIQVFEIVKRLHINNGVPVSRHQNVILVDGNPRLNAVADSAAVGLLLGLEGVLRAVIEAKLIDQLDAANAALGIIIRPDQYIRVASKVSYSSV